MFPKIVVDFNNIGSRGVRLATVVTIYDLARQRISLSDGVRLQVYDGELEAIGNVSFSVEDFSWVLMPDVPRFRRSQLIAPEFPELQAALDHRYFDVNLPSDAKNYEHPRIWCDGNLTAAHQPLDSAGSYIDIARQSHVSGEGALILLHNNSMEVKARLFSSSDRFRWEAEITGLPRKFKGRPFVIHGIDMGWRQSPPQNR